jgi:hypothetical protein
LDEHGDVPDPAQLRAALALLHEHLEGSVAAEPWVQAVEFDPAIPRWYVRFGTETRDAATVYLEPHQRSLHYEVYFLPDPGSVADPAAPNTVRRRQELYELLLRANHSMLGPRFSIGPDGDVYLVGRVLLEHLDVAALDRVLGELYALTERWFPPAIALLRAAAARE